MTRLTNEIRNKAAVLANMSSFKHFERQFEAMLPKLLLRPFDWRWPGIPVFSPEIEIIDQGNTIFVRTELPGVKKDDLTVTLTDHSLCIKALTSCQGLQEKKHSCRQQSPQGQFYKSVELPYRIDESTVAWLLKDGVFQLTVVKLGNSNIH